LRLDKIRAPATTSAMHKMTVFLMPALLASPTYAIQTPARTPSPVLTCKAAAKDGLTYTVIKAGKGERPTAESKVKVSYKGYLKTDGSKFDEGEAAEFKISGVIPGFAQGLQLMQPGGSYRLCIPAALGYGETGTGPIPANADLVFEVDLLSFTTPPPKPVIPVAERTCTQTTASGLGFALVQAGSGLAPTSGDMALVDFTVFDAASGVVQEQRLWEKIPLSQATDIFAEGLKMMQPGATYRFCMPKSAEAQAQASNIVVTLIDVRPAPVVD
jgi:FKBP-type peptidyl-prolyl cis-trans isomerase